MTDIPNSTLLARIENVVERIVGGSSVEPGERARLKDILLDYDLERRTSAELVKKIKLNPKLLACFQYGGDVSGAIVASDIRRSTMLMEQAKTTEGFATFLKELNSDIYLEATRCGGVFEKFTGDGALCFFLDELCGKSALKNALIFSHNLAGIFSKNYERHHATFHTRYESGMGVGIDYGNFSIKVINGNLNIIGQPVVYACRLSSGLPGTVIVNNQAKSVAEQDETINRNVSFTTHSVETKEGNLIAFKFVAFDEFSNANPIT